MDNYLRDELIKDNVKEKLKSLYKDIVIDDIKEELIKSKEEVLQNINDSSEKKKFNKEVINKLDQLLVMIDMIESREENNLKNIAFNNKLVLVSNIILVILLILSFFV
ncbi:hypothetical protein [Clostridium nigeriense]|uniref:hypothetical protein n=1 Tax=Clostridium nigeriense TaxID=1805470 RepID=UPI000829C33C|nr:hypothetical protein [Clostridium nigeriense]